MFVRQACLKVEPLGCVLSVSTPYGETLLSNKKKKACHIEIAKYILDVTIIVLGMHTLMEY